MDRPMSDNLAVNSPSTKVIDREVIAMNMSKAVLTNLENYIHGI